MASKPEHFTEIGGSGDDMSNQHGMKDKPDSSYEGQTDNRSYQAHR